MLHFIAPVYFYFNEIVCPATILMQHIIGWSFPFILWDLIFSYNILYYRFVLVLCTFPLFLPEQMQVLRSIDFQGETKFVCFSKHVPHGFDLGVVTFIFLSRRIFFTPWSIMVN